MLIKTIIFIMMLLIIGSLGSALYYLMKPSKTKPHKMATMLSIRIGLAMTLFILLLLGFAMGWIQPHML